MSFSLMVNITVQYCTDVNSEAYRLFIIHVEMTYHLVCIIYNIYIIYQGIVDYKNFYVNML